MEEDEDEEEEIGDSEEEEAPFTPNMTAVPLTPEPVLGDEEHYDMISLGSSPLRFLDANLSPSFFPQSDSPPARIYTPPPPMDRDPSPPIRFFDLDEYELAITDTEDDGDEDEEEYELDPNPFGLNEASEEEDREFAEVPVDVRRLIIERVRLDFERFVAAAAQPRQMQLMDKDQREQRIKELREENEQSAIVPPRFSRSCGVCYTESPRQRSVFVQCGHTTCSACALQIADGSTLLVCPFCREETDFIKLFETEIEQGKVENEKVAPMVPTLNHEDKEDTAEAHSSRPTRPRLFRRAINFVRSLFN